MAERPALGQAQGNAGIGSTSAWAHPAGQQHCKPGTCQLHGCLRWASAGCALCPSGRVTWLNWRGLEVVVDRVVYQPDMATPEDRPPALPTSLPSTTTRRRRSPSRAGNGSWTRRATTRRWSRAMVSWLFPNWSRGRRSITTASTCSADRGPWQGQLHRAGRGRAHCVPSRNFGWTCRRSSPFSCLGIRFSLPQSRVPSGLFGRPEKLALGYQTVSSRSILQRQSGRAAINIHVGLQARQRDEPRRCRRL